MPSGPSYGGGGAGGGGTNQLAKAQRKKKHPPGSDSLRHGNIIAGSFASSKAGRKAQTIIDGAHDTLQARFKAAALRDKLQVWNLA